MGAGQSQFARPSGFLCLTSCRFRLRLPATTRNGAAYVRVSLDSLSDSLPGRSVVLRIAKRQFNVQLNLRHGSGKPDVVRATSMATQRQVPSKTVAVGIK